MSGLDQLRSHRIWIGSEWWLGSRHRAYRRSQGSRRLRYPALSHHRHKRRQSGRRRARRGNVLASDRADAQSIFWPRLLHGRTLERFSSKYLPGTFAELEIPVIAIATELPARRVLAIAEGNLASAISASCAMPGVRRVVNRAGKQLKDGGIACVLPSAPCRSLGAEFIIGADVWEVSSLLNEMSIGPIIDGPRAPTRRITTRPCGTPISSSGRASPGLATSPVRRQSSA